MILKSVNEGWEGRAKGLKKTGERGGGKSDHRPHIICPLSSNWDYRLSIYIT